MSNREKSTRSIWTRLWVFASMGAIVIAAGYAVKSRTTLQTNLQTNLMKSLSINREIAGSATLWDQWYAIWVKRGNIHYSYYHELVEITKGRLHFQNDVWKKEEDYINRESLGAFAEANPELSPLFYNFRATFRTTETIIDGNVENKGSSRFFTAKARVRGAELPVIKKGIPHRTFFEVFFPVWLAKQLPGLKEGRSVSFSTLMEDDLDHEFSVEEGSARLEKSDEVAIRTHSRKVSVLYRGMPSTWWLSDKGYAERIEMPSQELVVERVSKATAEAFLATSVKPSDPHDGDGDSAQE